MIDRKFNHIQYKPFSFLLAISLYFLFLYVSQLKSEKPIYNLFYLWLKVIIDYKYSAITSKFLLM